MLYIHVVSILNVMFGMLLNLSKIFLDSDPLLVVNHIVHVYQHVFCKKT